MQQPSVLCFWRIFVSNDPPLSFSLTHPPTHLPVQVWGYKHTTSSYTVMVYWYTFYCITLGVGQYNAVVDGGNT